MFRKLIDEMFKGLTPAQGFFMGILAAILLAYVIFALLAPGFTPKP